MSIGLYRTTAAAAALTGLVACLSACGSSSSTSAGAAGATKNAPVTVTLAQPLQIPAYLSIDEARAAGDFSNAGINLKFGLTSGGDSSALAALSAGNIQFAAVGTQAPVLAISKGQPYEFVYCLDSQMSLQLVMSDGYLASKNVTASSPLSQRLGAMKGATIGVSAVGGEQAQVADFYAKAGGLDPSSDIKIAQIGPPPALLAALQHGEIDGFVLSPPEGQEAQALKVGTPIVSGSEVPGLSDYCDLALVTTKSFAQSNASTVTRVAQVLDTASREAQADPAGVAASIHQAFYKTIPTAILQPAVSQLAQGTTGLGEMTVKMMSQILAFEKDTGASLPSSFTAQSGEGVWWTNQFLPAK